MQRGLVIAAAEGGAVEQVHAAVVRCYYDEVPVVVTDDDGRRVEVGAGSREPALQLQCFGLERDDRARVARLFAAGRRGSGRGLGRSGVNRPVRAHGHAGGPGDAWTTRPPADRLRLIGVQIEGVDAVRDRTTAVRRGRVEDAVHQDQRPGPGVGRKKWQSGKALGPVVRVERADEPVAAEHEDVFRRTAAVSG
jgi:hypothetical protein